MIERPILYSTDMVKAVLQNLKRMTRRMKGLEIINTSPDAAEFVGQIHPSYKQKDQPVFRFKPNKKSKFNSALIDLQCPYGKAGDILWVRETFFDTVKYKHAQLFADSDRYLFKSEGAFIGDHKWKPSIHMPKVASRIWLQIENIRVERLHSITEEDAIAEGIESMLFDDINLPNIGVRHYKHYLKDKFGPSPTHSFQTLWISINGQPSWDLNPWVWVITFKILSTTGRPSSLGEAPSGFKTKNSVKSSGLKSSPSGTTQTLAIEATPAPGNGEGKEVHHG